ncbi:MAG: aminoacyl-tRNA hydrolase [Bacteroidia bacterium]|nr:aminoacyl-tRNA hydrolase [Bacteroidia bacterium]MCC6767966.1 aminoacyl-tRNA hydrolase [Bacteroidia bacterium]
MNYLVCGLGNPGNEYAFTRHNIGFLVLDKIAEENSLAFEEGRYGWQTTLKHKGRRLLLLKPNTYMNLSGKAVQYWMTKEKIPLENLLVITDDIALPFGKVRLRTKGSDGGHNGLKSIQETLGTTDYSRLRFGVGSEFAKGAQAKYVLSTWNDMEASALNEKTKLAAEMVKSFASIGPGLTMTQFNNR